MIFNQVNNAMTYVKYGTLGSANLGKTKPNFVYEIPVFLSVFQTVQEEVMWCNRRLETQFERCIETEFYPKTKGNRNKNEEKKEKKSKMKNLRISIK